jgi:glycosyltransferase involved in cell wall biosynthesis
MRIMIVTDAWEPQVNGVVTTLKNTQEALKGLGHEVMVIHPAMFWNVPCPGYPEIRLSILARPFLSKMLDSWNPDKIHIATEGPLGLAMRKILTKRGEQWSSSFHTKFAEYIEARLGFGRDLAWRWLRSVYKRDKFILVTTESMKEEMVGHGFEADKMIVWGRGVDENVFYPNYDRQGPCWPAVLLNVGRVSVEKNLEAFYELDVPGIKVQVGDGPMLETYKARYPDVKFVGAKFGHELADYYRDADVMVFPSKSDTFGLVMIESMRCGTPVAAFPVTGPKDIVLNGKNGYMNEDLAMAVNLAQLTPRRDVRLYSEQFTWENATAQFVKALVPRK